MRRYFDKFFYEDKKIVVQCFVSESFGKKILDISIEPRLNGTFEQFLNNVLSQEVVI